MTMKLTGKNGVLRIYSNNPIFHSGTLLNASVDIVTWDGASTWTNVTTDVYKSDANYTNNFLTDNDDAVFIGSDRIFSMFRYKKDEGSDYAAGSGAMKIYYYDGTDFSNEVTGVVDKTLSGSDCFGQDGYPGFKIPRDWSLGANSFNANLDSDKYYIKVMTTTSPTTDPDADVIVPIGHQYFEVPFANMDFSAPIARPLTDESLILNRGKMDAYGHRIELFDDKIYDPIPISFSCSIDSTYNNEQIFQALECGDPNSTYWNATGSTSKGSTLNDGTNYNPALVDSNKKCVNIQILWSGSIYSIGFAFYEVFFPKEVQNISESDDAITLSCEGGVYGLIERIYGFGNRY